ncbi:MAG: DUF4410 domain-containing protein, partial [Myxococcota bacterium]
MKTRAIALTSLAAVILLGACAKIGVSDREVLVTEKVPRPKRILVYDFAATPSDVSAQSALAGQASAATEPQSAEEIALGRKLGSEIANELASNIVRMGLPAQHATASEQPAVGDLLIRGTLLTIDEGSAVQRVAIGLGKGNAELKTAVEGFLMTSNGLVKVGSGTLATEGGDTPGAALPVVVMLATKNPLGLIVSTGVKGYGEYSGSSTVYGKAKETA